MRGARTRRSGRAAAGLLGLLALSAGVGADRAAAEERTVQAVGVAAIRSGLRLGAARERAVASGIAQAVYQVAAEELPALDAAAAGDAARRHIGGKARDYVTRFRMIDDRGTQPRQYSQEAGVTHEYVVVVEASVDARAVRERLVQAGLLAPMGEGSERRIHLVLEELPSYGAYQAIREALIDQLQVEKALPVEFTAGRAVLEVTTREDGRRLLARLAALPLPGVRVEPVEADDRLARARVRAP